MTGSGLTSEQRSEVEALIDGWVTDNEIPSAAVAIVDSSEVIYSEGFGTDGESADPDTMFQFGSCSKTITALAVTHLAEQGEIALDDPVDDYVPYLKDAPGEPITIAELLGHTSGLVEDGTAVSEISDMIGVGESTPSLETAEDFHAHMSGAAEGRVTNSDDHRYSNTGYVVLGQIIEEVTDRQFSEYVSENVFDALGMARSTLDYDEFEGAENTATPSIMRDGEIQEVTLDWHDFTKPAGGLATSPRDAVQILRLLAGDGIVGGEKLFENEVEAMKDSPTTCNTRINGTTFEYGYGVRFDEFLDDRLVGHTGDALASKAWFGYLEERELGMVVACTTTPSPPPYFVGKKVLASLVGEDPKEAIPFYRLMPRVQRAVGEYEGPMGVNEATVKQTGAGLEVTIDEHLEKSTALLVPEAVEDDALVCKTTNPMGLEQEARFEFRDDGVTLLFRNFGMEKAE